MTLIQGFATPEGTERYRSRFSTYDQNGHFHKKADLLFSSIGIGSYLGELDQDTDEGYSKSLMLSLESGINVIDSAINYRAQRSERAFGKAIKQILEEKKVSRDEMIVCTKAGYIPFDDRYPEDPAAYIEDLYIQTGILKPEDIVQECHAMTPAFLDNQLERSRNNFGLETLDIFYLHNPETQLAEIKRVDFLSRIQKAFAWCEQKVLENKIRFYGVATWNGFRVPNQRQEYLSLEELMVAAREAGGAKHHFRVVQLPVNLAMPEGWVYANQIYGAHTVPFLNIAERYDMIVLASASLLQSRLAQGLPDFLGQAIKGLDKSSQKSLQFARSVPGITTALVGMKSPEHVSENIETAAVPPLSLEELILMFQKAL